ncbi:hypothetical protein [Streptomyces tsukubensis]|uniref:Uncharacterized protein n=1 Tax=Streptomyces tsukubensis TaxID=83656 RepID=A0A1V3ZZZ0_9ACTN|nr:hypothetical protein [Streptomyces tsukubensis]OON71771.1 hypothetical protein B1H18_32330 [Streptomyces tsukubensis]QFR97044.1 hypothetical protein GBW32_33285 [Streptomyces tsukubensis]
MSQASDGMTVSTQDPLREAAREELAHLWRDLDDARHGATNGYWSMRCDWVVARIKRLTPLVGPTPWPCIQTPLLEQGIYQRVHAELGIPAPVDMDDVARVREGAVTPLR